MKVKPNQFHEGISLDEVGKSAGDRGQQIRLEVHGPGTQKLSVIKAIMDVADDPNVKVCWNSNPEDLSGNGLEHNFNLVKNRLGDTVHVHEINTGDYPYQDLMDLLGKIDYAGWILLECSTTPEDKITAMIEQREVWESMLHG